MPSQFQWNDPFLIANQFTEEEKLVQESTKQFAQKHLQPIIAEAYRNESFNPQTMKEMGTQGLLGSTLPEEYGGSNLSYTAYGIMANAIENIDSGFRSTMSVQSSLVMHPIHAYGTTQQKETYLPKLASGEIIGCFGLTEPDIGSNPADIKTKATKTNDGYKISGQKMWITNSPVADIAIVWAKLDDQIRAFLITKEAKGISFPAIKNKMSLRASPTGEIIMDNVEVGEDAILPEAVGLKATFECLNRARYGIAWGALGAAEACWHIARQYTLDRKQFGKPIAANQLIQKKLADMQTEIHIGLQACLRVGRLMDENQCPPEAISIIKRNSCIKALDIARTARDMLGANGIAEEYSIMRHLCNLETVITYEGTQDMHALILGRAQIDIQAFF